ncbi:hypothetical protein MNEG_6792 [Monoraphidium neglectum]|uniref:Uncharacterized protein n=1 Tax=Monoraphidium neglectum TaxID=145388 RepID=A0A0D2L1G9_9CHLO|nr:hypothetical protein MNEG_6792 [Monoraphidium neglectum]KIZ01169.1 hypothetical protein MNEG_6792 [Monoraphidium neglectum]|eukprot:XP_013900188.1 hypothetical protein MNEG_6792 [Monoraphidium neglectum]
MTGCLAALAAAVLLLLLRAPAPSSAAPASGSCVVGTFIGLWATQLKYTTTYQLKNGRTSRIVVTVKPNSADNGARGAASGKLPLVLAGTNCNFSDSALSRKDPGYEALNNALTGFSIGGASAILPTFRIDVSSFQGNVDVTKRLATNTTFAVNGMALDLAINGSLKPGIIKAFRPKVTFPSGTIAITSDYSRVLNSGAATGSFGINATALAALAPVKKASICKFSLKGAAGGGAAKFVLRCSTWNAVLGKFTAGGLTASVAFRQATGKGAVALQAEGLLSAAYRLP